MDDRTGLICVGLVVVSAAVILLVSMFGITEKTYEEAIAEQRKLPDDLLLGKREKVKEKKHKNKAGKKVKEKKEEKEEKDDEKNEHVQFEENPQIFNSEMIVQEEKNVKNNKKKGKIERIKPILINKDEHVVLAPELSPSQPQPEEINHFNLTQPKDDLELIRSHSRENLQHATQSEPIVSKSPRDTPTKSKKNFKEQGKKSAEIKEEKREVVSVASAPLQHAVQETSKEVKEQQKETPVKEVKEISKETAIPVQSSTKESKSKKKRNDILAQIGGDKDGINISLLMPLVQKAELSRSEIQILIDQLLNKQLDNPLEHSEWTEGRADPVIKLKKQLAEKEKALADEQEASVAVQNKLKELRMELNAEKSRLSANVRQLEEALSTKITETQTLHTRVQHILESHAAEKQGFSRQIEQLQSKVNENMTIIHKMQEDQGQTQGHMQQELIAQRKQLEVQFSQMRDNENALKAQLAQKHAESQELQNLNMTVTQELQMLQSTCENSATEIEVLRQQLAIMQDQFMQSEGQLQHYKETGERLQDMARQLEESHRTLSDLEHRLQIAHRHEQELQKQLSSMKSELSTAKNDASESANLKVELNKVQSELNKLKSQLSVSQKEAKTEAVEITSLQTELVTTRDDLLKCQSNLISTQTELKKSQSNTARIQGDLDMAQRFIRQSESELREAQNEVKTVKTEFSKVQNELSKIQSELSKAQEELKNAHNTESKLKMLTADFEKLQQSEQNSSASQIEITRLQEENDRLSSQSVVIAELQKEIGKLRDENESLASQLAATTERPAVEGRENGLETKALKNNVQLIEHNNLVAQKESLLDELRTEVTQKNTELSKLTTQLEALQDDIHNERGQVAHLRDELELQKTKNNELSEKVKIAEQKSTEALLQRIFPDITVSETSHEKWLNTFEQKVSAFLTNIKRNKDSSNPDLDLEKQNRSLQEMVAHYKQIINDTEGMLKKLQNHTESEEARWHSQLQQKEEDLANLKIELNSLRTNSGVSEKLKEKLSELETRLAEAETFKHQAQTELANLQVKREQSAVKRGTNQGFNALEQLSEEKTRLQEALQRETSNKATVDAELTKLRSLLEISESSLAEEKNLVSQLHQELCQLKNEVYGGCSSSDQSTMNGPPVSNSSKTESTAVAQSLLAALEKTLKNTELAKCPVTESTNLVQCRQEPDTSFLISKTSPQTCDMIDHNTQASWNPLIGQQHKKHKKKRKGGSGKK
ncbi:myosin-6 isoform X2 [Athalia rosae]|uniref:myosin-6 isoform X2 n=1 Tax=Athalia rosae TaxID=37344 RepID=UPI002033AD84|nr:myosin-6 isoform X2 [Athalia rosae]